MKINEEQAEVLLSKIWGDYKMLQMKLYRTEKENEEIKSGRETVIKQLEAKTNECEGMRKEVARAKELLEENVALIETYKERVKDVEGDIINSNLKIRVEELEAEVKKANEKVTNALNDITEAKKEVTSQKIKITRQKEKIEYAEMMGFKFPPAPEMSSALKKAREEKEDAKVEEKKIDIPQGAVAVKYERRDMKLCTPCPNKEKNVVGKVINVGSKSCTECAWYKGTEGNNVFCGR